MSYSTYLLQLPSSYYFRFHVPVELQKIVGRKELRYSLRTGSKAEAKPIARLLAGKLQVLFNKLKGHMMSSQELSQKQIQGIIKNYVDESLDQDNQERIHERAQLFLCPIQPTYSDSPAGFNAGTKKARNQRLFLFSSPLFKHLTNTIFCNCPNLL